MLELVREGATGSQVLTGEVELTGSAKGIHGGVLLAAVVEHVRRTVGLLDQLLAAADSRIAFSLINSYNRIRISCYYFHA